MELKKNKIVIDKEIKIYEGSLEAINKKIDDALTTKEVATDIKQLLSVELHMKNAKKEFDKLVKEQLMEYENKMTQLTLSIKKIKELALKDYQTNVIKKEYFKVVVDDETGEAHKIKKTKVTSPLPKGIVFNKGRVSFDYDEDKITDDKFYKKTLNKTLVKKAVENGELPQEVMVPKVGSPSVTLNLLALEKGLEDGNNK